MICSVIHKHLKKHTVNVTVLAAFNQKIIIGKDQALI